MNGIDNSNVVQIECPLNCIETNLWLGKKDDTFNKVQVNL